MILSNNLNIHFTECDRIFPDNCIEREIVYDKNNNDFSELTPYDGIVTIENIILGTLDLL